MRFKLIGAWLIMNNRLVSFNLLILLFLVNSSIFAARLSGKIIFDEHHPDINFKVSVNKVSSEFTSNQFFIETTPAERYELKIEAKGYYTSFHTFSHYELAELSELSKFKSEDDFFLPSIHLVKKKIGRVMFAFGGDVMMGRRYLKPYFNEPILIHENKILSDTKSIVQYIKPYMELADYSSVNLETVISQEKPKKRAPKGVVFYSPPETLSALTWAGIDYVSLGNNHIYDYLDEGLISTFKHLNDSGLKYSGAGFNHKQAMEASHTTISNNKYAMLGFVGWKGSSKLSQVAESDKGGAALGTRDNIIEAVKAESDKDYITLVQYHGSLEYSDEPTGMTESRLKAAIDHGADLVLAHHPHVTQGFEIYKEKLIAYSIGNFIFDQYFHTPPVSFILYVWMDDDKFHRAELVPIYIKGYVPAPATGIQRTTLNKRVKTLSNRRELSLSSSGGHLVIGNKTLEDVTMEVELKFTDSIRVRDLYKFPVTGQLTSVVSNKPTVNYRLGENQINGGDFESFNLFSSKERGWLLENAKLSSLKASSGSNSVELNLKQGKTTLVGMKYFRRVFSAGNPMTYKARILTTSHPIKLRLLIQRRKKRDKLFDALEGNKKELLKEIVIASNKSWQDIEIDFNTPRVGYRSYRILLEISHVNKDANVDRIDDKPVFIDDIALVKWQGYYNESGKLPYDHSILGLATHLGIEKIDTDVNLKLKFN